MSLQSLTPEQAFNLISHNNVVAFNMIATSTLMFWEYCITFSQEVDLVWRSRSRWRVINCLFFIIRYGTLALQIVGLLFYVPVGDFIHPDNKTICRNWLIIQVAGTHIILLAMEILLAMRTYAFYGQSQKMWFILSGIVLSGQAAATTIVILEASGLVSVPSPLRQTLQYSACTIIHSDPLYPFCLLPTAVVQTCLTLLVTIKFFSDKLMGQISASHLLIVFIRDGAWAFALAFADLVWTVVTYNTDPLKGDLALPWLFTVTSFCGTRLILNLRAEASGNKTSTETHTITTISFASPDLPSCGGPNENNRMSYSSGTPLTGHGTGTMN